MDVSRDEFDALLARVRRLEAMAPSGFCTQCGAPVGADWRFCSACGAPRLVERPAAAPLPAPSAPSPAPRAPATFTPVAPAAPARPRANLETLVGQRFAPRLGALLVFLAALFFLGLGIQRGWIGPVAQLIIAALAGGALVGAGVWLARKGGYGAYPLVLIGTGASILYAAAFVSHALPYYERATGLTALGSGVLMAVVALGTVGLALALDARPIVGLGYALAFLTAGLGWGVLPDLTLAYVALLGASLAALVLWKGWPGEAALGTLATGGLLLALAYDDARSPSDAMVALVAMVPAAAFLALTIRAPRDERDETRKLLGLVAGLTLAWAAAVSIAPLPDEERPTGIALLAWAAIAGALAFLARERVGPQRVVPMLMALAFYAIGIPLAWDGLQESALLTTLSYAAAGFALAAFARERRGVWLAGAAMAGLATLSALAGELLSTDALTGGTELLGPWQAYVLLVALAPLLALLALLAPTARGGAAAVLAVAAFGAVWGLALFRGAFPLTLWLVALAGGLALVAARRPALGDAAVAAALALVAAAGVKVALVDMNVEPEMHPALAAIEAALVAALLLWLHHGGALRRFDVRAPLAGGLLVAASALVLGSWAFTYLPGPWVSVALGALGVAYLATGFLLRAEAVYRWTGFGVLGLVLVRVFLVDLSRTDLAVRAGIFAILGLILLGVGYAYARAARAGAPPGGGPGAP